MLLRLFDGGASNMRSNYWNDIRQEVGREACSRWEYVLNV